MTGPQFSIAAAKTGLPRVIRSAKVMIQPVKRDTMCSPAFRLFFFRLLLIGGGCSQLSSCRRFGSGDERLSVVNTDGVVEEISERANGPGTHLVFGLAEFLGPRENWRRRGCGYSGHHRRRPQRRCVTNASSVADYVSGLSNRRGKQDVSHCNQRKLDVAISDRKSSPLLGFLLSKICPHTELPLCLTK